MQAHGDQGVGSQLPQGALVAHGSRRGGDGVQGRIHQEGVGAGHEHAHLAHSRARLARPGHMTLRGVAPSSSTHSLGVQRGERPVHVPAQLGARAVRGPAQHSGLHRLRHAGGLALEPSHQQSRLGLVQQTHPVQALDRRQPPIEQPEAAVHQLRGSRARDTQTACDLASGVPAPRHHVTGRRRLSNGPALLGPILLAVLLAILIPLPPRGRGGEAAHLRAEGQTRGRHSLRPLRPSGQTPARRHQLAQAIRAQLHQCSDAPLAIDHQRPRGLGQHPLTRFHHTVEQSGAGGPGRVVRTGGPDEQRRHQPLDHVGQPGARHHPRETHQDALNPIGGSRGRARSRSGRLPGSAPLIEHMYTVSPGYDTKPQPLTMPGARAPPAGGDQQPQGKRQQARRPGTAGGQTPALRHRPGRAPAGGQPVAVAVLPHARDSAVRERR